MGHRLKAFGISKFVYSGRSRKPEAEASLQAEYVSFDALLQQSDVIVICCALTAETKDMFNYDAFSKMKNTAVLVNSARGGIVHQDDLGKLCVCVFICAKDMLLTNTSFSQSVLWMTI